MLFGVAGTWKGKKKYPDKTEIKSEEKCTQEKTRAEFLQKCCISALSKAPAGVFTSSGVVP